MHYLFVIHLTAFVICTGLHNIKGLVEKRHCSFIDKLISDVRFSNLLLVYGSNAQVVLSLQNIMN